MGSGKRDKYMHGATEIQIVIHTLRMCICFFPATPIRFRVAMR